MARGLDWRPSGGVRVPGRTLQNVKEGRGRVSKGLLDYLAASGLWQPGGDYEPGVYGSEGGGEGGGGATTPASSAIPGVYSGDPWGWIGEEFVYPTEPMYWTGEQFTDAAWDLYNRSIDGGETYGNLLYDPQYFGEGEYVQDPQNPWMWISTIDNSTINPLGYKWVGGMLYPEEMTDEEIFNYMWGTESGKVPISQPGDEDIVIPPEIPPVNVFGEDAAEWGWDYPTYLLNSAAWRNW
jgi:hypothetical protein